MDSRITTKKNEDEDFIEYYIGDLSFKTLEEAEAYLLIIDLQTEAKEVTSEDTPNLK